MTLLKPTQTDPHLGSGPPLGWPVETATTSRRLSSSGAWKRLLHGGRGYGCWFKRAAFRPYLWILVPTVRSTVVGLGWFVAVSGCFFFWNVVRWRKRVRKHLGFGGFLLKSYVGARTGMTGGDFLFELEKKHHLRLHIQPHSVVGIMISIFLCIFPKMLFCLVLANSEQQAPYRALQELGMLEFPLKDSRIPGCHTMNQPRTSWILPYLGMTFVPAGAQQTNRSRSEPPWNNYPPGPRIPVTNWRFI